MDTTHYDLLASQTPSTRQYPGMKPGYRLHNIGIGVLYCFLIMSILGAALPDPEGGSDTAPETTTTTEAVTTTTAGDTVGGADTDADPTTATTETTETTTTTTATTTTTTATTMTVAPAEDGESYEFSGSGSDVTDGFSTEGGLVVIHFQHDGSSNFQV